MRPGMMGTRPGYSRLLGPRRGLPKPPLGIVGHGSSESCPGRAAHLGLCEGAGDSWNVELLVTERVRDPGFK